MRRARFTEEQIIVVLKEHETGAKAADLARMNKVSEATLYNWKPKFGGMDGSEAKRLKQLEEENAKLKKLLAEPMLDAAASREPLSKSGRARRQARGRRTAGRQHGPVGTGGLHDRRRGPTDGSLPLHQWSGQRLVLYALRREGPRADLWSLPLAVSVAVAMPIHLFRSARWASNSREVLSGKSMNQQPKALTPAST